MPADQCVQSTSQDMDVMISEMLAVFAVHSESFCGLNEQKEMLNALSNVMEIIKVKSLKINKLFGNKTEVFHLNIF